MTNKGAYAKLGIDKEIRIAQYYAWDMRAMDISKYRAGAGGDERGSKVTPKNEESLNSSEEEEEEGRLARITQVGTERTEELLEDVLEKETVARIVEVILDKKDKLHSYFTEMDSERQGNNTLHVAFVTSITQSFQQPVPHLYVHLNGCNYTQLLLSNPIVITPTLAFLFYSYFYTRKRGT